MVKRHRSKDCARIEKAEDVGKDQGGVKGTEYDTERVSGLERKLIICGEVRWGGDFNDDNPLKSAHKCP